MYDLKKLNKLKFCNNCIGDENKETEKDNEEE